MINAIKISVIKCNNGTANTHAKKWDKAYNMTDRNSRSTDLLIQRRALTSHHLRI